MYLFIGSLKDKRKCNVLELLPSIIFGEEWISFNWLWIEWVVWAKEGAV